MYDNFFLDISNKKIDLNLFNFVLSDGVGAIVSFTGVVRYINNGKLVNKVEYYIFDSLAKSLLYDRCVDFFKSKNIIKICIFQRCGSLYVGDVNLIIGVSSFDRNSSFNVTRSLLEYIKHNIPIWKKEYYTDLTHCWINSF